MADKDFTTFTRYSSPKFDPYTGPAANEVIAPAPSYSWYNPLGWSLRHKLLAATLSAIAITTVAVVVGTIEGLRSTRYPDYTPLRYKLIDSYTPSTFLDRFNYYSDPDPTDGFVHYVNKSTASALNLTYTTSNSAILRVDTSDPNARTGRRSVRLESKSSYDSGLFIFDILHTPYGCGTWPALWLTDPTNWPVNGEIDVLETSNRGNNGNAVTLHTTPGCEMDVRRKQMGKALYTSCDNETHGNAGCGVVGEETTFGEAFNAGGGGIYALELRPEGIRTWFFPRSSIPSDLTTSNATNDTTTITTTPQPSTWGKALADFPNTNCDIEAHFSNQSIIANIDLCGELGADPGLYTELNGCPATCEDFVAHNPGNFTQAFWEFKSFRVFQADYGY